ncbi:SPRY domain-containing protein 3 isoform X3 [Rhinoraja longicauda]
MPRCGRTEDLQVDLLPTLLLSTPLAVDKARTKFPWCLLSTPTSATFKDHPSQPTLKLRCHGKMEDFNLHYRFLNWRRRIREIREVRAVRHQERYKRILVDGDILSYHGNSDEVGCYVAPRPLTKENNYFEVCIMDTGVRGTIAVGLVPQYYKLDHQPGWLPHSVAYHADDGKLFNGNGVGQQFGPKCFAGDRIGCGVQTESFDRGMATVFFTRNGKEVGSVVMAMSPDGLFPAVGMHSLGEEVRIDLQAEWGLDEDDTAMMVDSHEDEWGRLHDVKVCGTLLEYVGKGKSIMDVGLAQARHSLSTRSHYFEVEIVDPGEKCYIALGLARKDYPKNRHPGWSRGSVAYHADPLKLCQVGWGASMHSYFQVPPEMFDRVQVQALAGPLKDIHRLVMKPLLRCLGCALKVVVLLEGEPPPQSEVQNALEQVFIKDLSVLCSVHLSLDPA